jgi:phage pi2 protein 07
LAVKDLLGFPEVISGYYVSNIVGGIMVSGEVREKDRVGVAYSGEQAKGIQAFCELSQILPIFNEGWNPDWNKNYEKWCFSFKNSSAFFLVWNAKK